MNILDHLITFVLVAGLPLYSARSWPRSKARIASGEPGARTRLYWGTCRVQWLLTAGLLVGWSSVGRPWSELGFSIQMTLGFWIAMAIVAALGVATAVHYIHALRTEESRREARAALGEAVLLVPHDRKEMRSFVMLAVTAGICEEILYRGFLIWYVARFTGTTVLGMIGAVAISSIAFGVGHLYQGPKSAGRIVGLAAVTGAIFVVGGSLWIVMALHVFVDIAGGLLGLALFRDDGAAASRSRGAASTGG